MIKQSNGILRIGIRWSLEALWYVRETNDLLAEYGATIVLHDIPSSGNLQMNKTAPCVYFKFHGPAGNYRDSYTKDFLQEQSARIQGLLKSGKDVYAYLNNTMGSAFENALTLKAMASL